MNAPTAVPIRRWIPDINNHQALADRHPALHTSPRNPLAIRFPTPDSQPTPLDALVLYRALSLNADNITAIAGPPAPDTPVITAVEALVTANPQRDPYPAHTHPFQPATGSPDDILPGPVLAIEARLAIQRPDTSTTQVTLTTDLAFAGDPTLPPTIRNRPPITTNQCNLWPNDFARLLLELYTPEPLEHQDSRLTPEGHLELYCIHLATHLLHGRTEADRNILQHAADTILKPWSQPHQTAIIALSGGNAQSIILD